MNIILGNLALHCLAVPCNVIDFARCQAVLGKYVAYLCHCKHDLQYNGNCDDWQVSL